MDMEYKVVTTFEKQNESDRLNTSLFRSYTGVEKPQEAGNLKQSGSYAEQIEKQRDNENHRKINQDALNNFFNQAKTATEPQPTKLLEKKKSLDISNQLTNFRR
jgi:hypothetical protein